MDNEYQDNEEIITNAEILNSVKLEEDEKPKIVKKDLPTPKEVTQMSDEEVVNMDTQVSELYDEFSSFLQTKAKITNEVLVKELIPSGIDIFDAILGGGYPVGTMEIIVGPPGAGKSMIVAKTLAAAQKKYNGKALVAYLDSEEAVTSIRLANLGVRFPKIKPYRDITVEKIFKFLEGLCLFKLEKNAVKIPSIIVWDSIANTITQKAREVDDINKVIGLKARMLSILLPKYVAKMTEYNICLLAVNQLRETLQMGQYAPSPDLKYISSNKNMPGGQALKYNAFHLAEMKIKKTLSLEKDTNKFPFDGVCVSAKLAKNKLFPPNIPVDILGNFKTGFSNFWTNFNFLCDYGRLKPGAWNHLVSLPTKKFRTKEAQILYNTDHEFKQIFDESVKETIQTEIVQKNTTIDELDMTD